MKHLLTLLLFCAAPAAAQQQTVNFKTVDGCRIEAYFMAPSSGAYVFVNTHGLGSGKGEWGPFQEALRARGNGYLSLDLRGHGGSLACGGKKTDYSKFSKLDWARTSRDITAAAAWLKKKGFPANRTILCGASIGANLSVKAAAEGAAPAAVILLSAGLDYAGLKPESYFSGGAYSLLIAAAQDDAYAWNSAVPLHNAAKAKKINAALMEGGSGHGVNMLKAPGVMDKILDWASGF